VNGGHRAIRVLDLTDDLAIAGTRTLVGIGADVVRVERTGAAPRSRAHELHWNVSKQIVRDADAGLLDEIAGQVDVIVESGPVASLRGVGFSENKPVSRWPHLVHVVVTPFGLTGPARDWQGDDLVLTAAGGMAWLGGRAESQPKPPPRDQAGQLAGAHAATAALLGLLARTRTGSGQLLDVSAQEAVAATLETGAIAWISNGSFPRRNGGVYAHVAHRIFATADGYAAGGYSGSTRMWTDLLAWMAELGLAEDLTDPVWADGEHRWAHRADVDEVVARFAARQTTAYVADQARERALPWATVATAADLPTNPQLRDRAYLLTVDDPGHEPPVLSDVGFAYESPSVPRPARLPAAREVRAPTWRGPRAEFVKQRGVGVGGGALTGLRVLDLTWVLAGPYATKQLAEHGADVIKIESRHRSDPTRFAPGMRLRPDASFDDGGYFLNFNRNKRSVAVNMRTDDGVALVQRLARSCDVVIDNFAPGVLARWGLDYPTLAADRPDILVVSMSGVGQTGPWRTAVTFADTLAAMSGLSDETRDPGGAPQGLTFGLGDMIAANAAVLAVMEHRLLGVGGAVDLSQLEAMATSMGTAVLDARLTPSRRTARTAQHPNRHEERVPHGLYPLAGDDRWVAVDAGSDRAWAALADLVPELRPCRELDIAGRRAVEDDIDARIAAWTARWTGPDLVPVLQQAGVGAAVVASGEDLVERDRHLAARGFYPVLDHPVAGPVRVEGIVVNALGTPGRLDRPAPLLGQHTEQVLSKLLGLDAGAIAALRDAGVLE
jgi:crotonobetainyl-CoA:carnitine CoA-transferase CaiB-like acyl-CoA transferase